MNQSEMAVQHMVSELNARENWEFLHQNAGHVQQVVDAQTGAITSIRLPRYGIALEPALLTEFPLHFRSMVESALGDLAVRMSHEQYRREQQQRVKPVPQTFGEQFRFSKAMKGFPICTICQENFKSNEKVWRLHGDQCCFHKRCLTKWFKRSSKCPNCNGDCANC